MDILALVPIAVPDPVLPPTTLLPEHIQWLEQHKSAWRSLIQPNQRENGGKFQLAQSVAHHLIEEFFPALSEDERVQFQSLMRKVREAIQLCWPD